MAARRSKNVGSTDIASAMAQEFAKAARKYSSWSTRIPAATRVVSVDSNHAQVVTSNSEAPNAYPFQYRIRHPLNYPNQRNAKHDKVYKRWMGGTPGKGPTRDYMTKAARDVLAIENALDVGLNKTIEAYWEKG